ncbi:MAG: hypothetical protein HC927_13285 [Deltaproteobacteria bacterium]|nr:hypothetical protein [Deltaproteobacteria bacterium]
MDAKEPSRHIHPMSSFSSVRSASALALGLLGGTIGCGAGQPMDFDDEVGEESEGEESKGEESGDETTSEPGTETGDGDGDSACFAGEGLAVAALRLDFVADRATLIDEQGERELELVGPLGIAGPGLIASADAARIFVGRNIWPGAGTRLHVYSRASAELEQTVDFDVQLLELWIGEERVPS